MSYATDSHLLDADGEVFARDERTTHGRTLARASADLERDLKGHGYLREVGERLVDARASARVDVVLEAYGLGAVVVPAGARLFRDEAEAGCAGVVWFGVREAVTIPAGTSVVVGADAGAWGELHNLEAGSLGWCEVEGVVSVVQAVPAVGGVDHQLVRATVYRALELLYGDWMRAADDAFDAKRKLYREMYRDELRRLVASGLEVSVDGEDAMSEAERLLKHGFHGFARS